MKERIYIAIDLKSFYASVECVDRGWNPLNTNLVVADNERGDGTICLAVSPSLKEFGVSSRPRLYEAKKEVQIINQERERKAREGILWKSSIFKEELLENKEMAVDFYVATPRMQYYLEISALIYKIYLKYVSAEDIHVYSIDEVFIDVTPYLSLYQTTAYDLAMKMIRDVLHTTGITATAGIGSNLFLAKVAMDIVAKHMEADEEGVRIASLDEFSFRRKLWDHQPLTDIWRIGGGISRRLAHYGIYTLGELAAFSLENEGVLFKEFGVNAELLIDHAWGKESVEIKDIKAYHPIVNSMSCGQVLPHSYSYEKALLIAKEMAEQLATNLVRKKKQTKLISFWVGYDKNSLKDETIASQYHGEIGIDYSGYKVPISPSASVSLEAYSDSAQELREAVEFLFKKIVNKLLLVRRIGLCACDVRNREEAYRENHRVHYEQMDMFTDYKEKSYWENCRKINREKESTLLQTIVQIKNKYGKNAIFKGMNLEEEATMLERNRQIGGHKA